MTDYPAKAEKHEGQEGIEVEWQLRMYREGDIPAIVALRNTANEYEGRIDIVTVGRLERAFANPLSDPHTQVVVVDGPVLDGVSPDSLLGYGRIVPIDDIAASERMYQISIAVHPLAREYGLEQTVAVRLMQIARAHEHAPGTTPVSNVTVLAITSGKSLSLSQLYRSIGLAEVRHGWKMERDLLEPIPEPGEIEGITLRPYRLPEDNEASLQAYNNSFIDHFEHHPPTSEMWEHEMGDPNFRADLSRLAEIDEEPGRLAGFCLCSIHKEDNAQRGCEEGWIELLGTVRGWRGKGLGKSLLLHGMRNLKAAGLTTAVLGVDAQSPTGANRLYESVGFKIREHDVVFKGSLAEAKV